MINSLSEYLINSSPITYIILAWLSIYIILIFWIFFYKYSWIIYHIGKERYSYEYLDFGRDSISESSSLYEYIESSDYISKELLNACKTYVLTKASSSLMFFSIVASTSPFIGLFGTVVSILESFAILGNSGQATFNTLAPIISEALVATAGGILTAIPAYSFHSILKRKCQILNSFLDMQIDIILSKSYNV